MSRIHLIYSCQMVPMILRYSRIPGVVRSKACLVIDWHRESNFSKRLFVGLRNSWRNHRPLYNFASGRNGARIYREHYRVILLLRSRKQDVSLAADRENLEKEGKECIRPIRPTGRVTSAFAYCILRRGGRTKCISASVRTANSFSFSSCFHPMTRYQNGMSFVSDYREIFTEIFAIRSKSRQEEM